MGLIVNTKYRTVGGAVVVIRDHHRRDQNHAVRVVRPIPGYSVGYEYLVSECGFAAAHPFLCILTQPQTIQYNHQAVEAL